MVMESALKAARFKAFESDGWSNVYAGYHDYFRDLTRQTFPALLGAVFGAETRRFLDIACGPGDLTEAAALKGADAYGVDFCPPMTELAKKRSAGYFLKGDAEDLPFRDAFFDAAVMNFGLMHLASPDAAAREAYRVLCPGGAFAFTVWLPPSRAKAFAMALDAVAEHGDPTIKLPEGPPFFYYSDRDAARALLNDAGFRDARFIEIDMAWRFRSAEDLFVAFYQGTARTGALLRLQPKEALVSIAKSVAEALVGYRSGDEYVVPMASLAVIGTK